jgi:hypothetical protein
MSSSTCERKYDIEEGEAPPHAAEKERHDTRRHKHHHSEHHHHREHRHRHKQPQMDIDEMEPSPLKAQLGRGHGLSTVDDTIKNDDVSLREEAEQGRKKRHDTIQPFSEANESETQKKEVEYVNLGKMPLNSLPEEEQHAPSFEPNHSSTRAATKRSWSFSSAGARSR